MAKKIIKKKISKKEIVAPAQNVSESKPVQKEINVIGIIGFVILVILVFIGVYYFAHNKKASAVSQEGYNHSITINGVEYPLRNDPKDFMTVDTFPNNLHLLYLVYPEADYYKIEWSESCEINNTCGVIALGVIDATRAVLVNYKTQTGSLDYVSIPANNSAVYLLKKELLTEPDFSKLHGIDVVLLTPGSTNQTKISIYETNKSRSVVIEGNDSDNFLKAIDKFSYLVLGSLVQSE